MNELIYHTYYVHSVEDFVYINVAWLTPSCHLVKLNIVDVIRIKRPFFGGFIFLQDLMSKENAEHQSINNVLMAFPSITV